MEKDLQNLWNDYSNTIKPKQMDEKTLEKLLTPRLKNKLKMLKFRSYYGLVVTIVVPPLVYGAFYKSVQNKTVYAAFGVLMLLGILWYIYQEFKMLKLTRSIDFANDTVKTLEEKLIKIQLLGTKFYENKKLAAYVAFASPFLYIVIDSFMQRQDSNRVLILIGAFLYLVFVYFWSKYKNRKYFKLKMQLLLDELRELEED